MANESNNTKVDIPEMLRRLNCMYDKEEELKIKMNNLVLEYNQLQEDKSMLQNMIMYQSNKLNRLRGFKQPSNE